MAETPAPPDTPRLMAAMATTWPAAETLTRGAWRLRRGAGGGNRVSAATWHGANLDGAPGLPDADDLASAEDAMRAWGQPPLFWLTPDEGALDGLLAARGYRVHEPVVFYAAPAAALTGAGSHVAKTYRADFRPAIMEEIWHAGGIGQGRFAIMDRAPQPKTYLMGRSGDAPCGAGFVALDGDLAMVHALEVRPALRRKGVARLMMESAARFAVEHGAHWLTLAVTEGNTPARALYGNLGMAVAGRYHYRIAPTPEGGQTA